MVILVNFHDFFLYFLGLDRLSGGAPTTNPRPLYKYPLSISEAVNNGGKEWEDKVCKFNGRFRGKIKKHPLLVRLNVGIRVPYEMICFKMV